MEIKIKKESWMIFKIMFLKRLYYNGSLQYTIGEDIFTGISSMTHKYLILDKYSSQNLKKNKDSKTYS